MKTFHFYTLGALKRLYIWTLSWAHSKYALLALFTLAFIEASFFPIPPDVLLIALAVGAVRKSFWFALIATVGSVLGAILGYYIGLALYDTIGIAIIELLHYQEQFALVGQYYTNNAFISILGAAFTPIPFKVFTIAAGVWKINLTTLLTASIIGRGIRFFAIATMIYFFGARIKTFIDKYFNILSIAALLLVILGFVMIKYLM
jgi:membrane protein YqaA with SNARE-associated domain